MSLKPLEQKGFELNWRAWRMPSDANPPEKPEGYMDEAKKFLEKLLKETGLQLNPPSTKKDTMLAHIGGKYARENGDFKAYQERIFRAVWEKDEDIENIEILCNIAEEVGLNADEFKKALNDRDYKELVEKDFHDVTNLKIWTIPSYVGERDIIQVHHFKDMPSIEQLETMR